MVSRPTINLIGNLNMIKSQFSNANPPPQGHSIFGNGGCNCQFKLIALLFQNKCGSPQGNNSSQPNPQGFRGYFKPQQRYPMPCQMPQPLTINNNININGTAPVCPQPGILMNNQMSIGAGSMGGIRQPMQGIPSVAMNNPMNIGAGSIGGMNQPVATPPSIVMGNPMNIGAGSIGRLPVQPEMTRPNPGMPVYPEVGGTPMLPAAAGTIGIGSVGQYPPPTMI